jgi:hypothetical protein
MIMADQSPILIRSEMGSTGYFCVYLVTVSTNDTFKVRDLLLAQGATGLKVTDWTPITCTCAGNVVTITQAGLSTVPVAVLVGGQK